MLSSISNGRVYAEIDSLGAELKSLRDDGGREYLWRGDPAYWGHSSPVLFPVAGALRGDSYVYGGARYDMPKHGFAPGKNFRKTSSRADAAEFRLSADDDTLRIYPFEFSLSVGFALRDRSLAVTFTVENRSKRTMPFAVGGHPGFALPFEEGETIDDVRLRFNKRETARCPLVTPESLLDFGHTFPVLRDEDTLPLRGALREADTLVFEGLNSTSVELYSANSGRGVRVDFPGFGFLAVWHPAVPEPPFVCIEPWTGTGTRTSEGDRLEDKRGTTLLEPGGAAEFSYTITLL